ncbi:MAG: hypothetical protein AABZ06_05430 [Bdellovibrionota bacterium]
MVEDFDDDGRLEDGGTELTPVAAILESVAIIKILTHLGLPPN